MELKFELQKLLAFRQMSWNLEELYPAKRNFKDFQETPKNSLELLRISQRVHQLSSKAMGILNVMLWQMIMKNERFLLEG